MSPVIRYSPGRYLGYPLSLQLRPPAVAGSAEHASARHRASTPDASAAVGMRAVQTALAANGAITLAKLGAFLATGSGTMLAETLHSLGDTVNQSLVAYGVWRASKAADAEHPYGYMADQFIFSLISAVGILFIGCGGSVYHGFHALAHPEPLTSSAGLWGAMAICGLTGGVEAYSLRVALSEVRREAAKDGKTLYEYIRHGSDPVNVGVLLEDAVAVGGAGVAMTALGLCMWTGNPLYDALGSIAIGFSLGAVSFVLVSKNRRLLLGQSIESKRLAAVRELLIKERSVQAVHDIKSVAMGPGVARFKAEVAFHPTALGLVYLQTGANQAELLRSFQIASVSAEPAIEAQTLFLAINELYGVLLGAEIDRCDGIGLPRIAPDCL
jgi:solute carrier family 30 (zinc transporter), member 9